MNEEQIRQNAEAYATDNYGKYDEHDYTDHSGMNMCHAVSEKAYIAGAHSRDEEVKRLYNSLEHFRSIINNLRNPWITDRMPEIKGSTSDAVVLLIDGMFYRVSRLERRKDGTEFWWGVHTEYDEEVDAWMPIPELKKEE